jgi:hypothetical protein
VYLELFIQFFKEPIEALWPEESKILFNNIDTLALISKELLEKLRKRLLKTGWTADNHLSDIFLEFVCFVPNDRILATFFCFTSC